MKIGLVAGESSGDLLGAGLIRAIKDRYPDTLFEGVAGPQMQAAGCEPWEPAESLAVMGLVEPIVHLPRLLRLRRDLASRWLQSPPDVFVGIDAPDFNLGLEKRLRRSGIPTVHYVSPSVWAWRSGRMKTVEVAADKILCILPFEKPLYDEYDVEAVFVGHPKADTAPETIDAMGARRALGLTADEVVAVLPGSRLSEVSRLGEIFVDAAGIIAKSRASIQFVTPVATPSLRSDIEAQIEASGLASQFVLLDTDSETAMSAADVVLLASGTAALEAALLTRPTVAAYRLAAINYFILVKLGLVKLSYVTLPNLLTEESLVPEFLQDDARPEAIAASVIDLLNDPDRRQFISGRFAKLRSELAQNTDQRAADEIIQLAQDR